MSISFALPRSEWLFGLLIATVHAGQHLFLRLFPPLIPVLVVDLEASLAQLGLLVSVYMFAGGLFQAPMGVVADRVDRQYLLVPAFALMGAGYLVFVLAPTVGAPLPEVHLAGWTFDGPYLVMAFGMFLAGVGYSTIHPVGYPLISANVSVENKGKVLGMWGSAAKIGDSAAPLIVGVLILLLAWEWIVVGISLFGFVFAVALFVVFRSGTFETRPPELDAEDDTSSGFDLRENPRQFLVPVAAIVISFFFILFASNGLQTYAPVFVDDVYGFSLSLGGLEVGSESIANFYFAVLLISGAISQLVVGSLADTYDHRTVLVTLLGVSAIALSILAFVSLTPMTLFLVFALLGSTLFGLNPARDGLISDITPAAYEGRTFGYIWTIALVGSSGYPAIIGYLADTMGLRASFSILAIGSLGALACIAVLYSPLFYQEQPAPSAAD